jgi:hypothetical protein
MSTAVDYREVSAKYYDNGLGRFMVRRTTIRKRMRAKLRQVGQQLRERMHDPVPQTEDGLSRSCKATSTTTRYRETSRVSVCFGIGCLCSGGVLFAAGARNAGSTGRASFFWLSAGVLNRERSIPFLMLASPPVIRDKNRMRFQGTPTHLKQCSCSLGFDGDKFVA